MSSSKASQAGFTLIELLVVISIIALLVGILLPALGAARRSAMSAVCLSNNRQIGVGFYAYSTDENGYLPPVGVYDNGVFTLDYWERLSPYYGYNKEDQLGLDYLSDPVDPRPAPPPFDADPNSIHGGVGYGMHYLAVTAYEAAPGSSKPFFADGPKRIEDLNLTLFMYGDAAGVFIYSPNVFTFTKDLDKDGVLDTNKTFGLDPLYNRFDPRHNGAGNLLIVDGSAEPVTVEAYVSNEDDVWAPILLK